jgi:hypothetical protein
MRDFANAAVRSLGVIPDKIFHEAIKSGNISLTDLTLRIRGLRSQQKNTGQTGRTGSSIIRQKN